MQEHTFATENAEIHHLLSMGFTENEATRLLHMKDHVTEHVEYRESVEESRRLGFMRWLIEHDRISR